MNEQMLLFWKIFAKSVHILQSWEQKWRNVYMFLDQTNSFFEGLDIEGFF